MEIGTYIIILIKNIKEKIKNLYDKHFYMKLGFITNERYAIGKIPTICDM